MLLEGRVPTVEDILEENKRRLDIIRTPFNPFTGLNSIGERVKVEIEGFPYPVQYLPKAMMKLPLIKGLTKLGLDGYINIVLHQCETDKARDIVLDTYIRTRIKYDFPYWAAMFVKIKPKDFGEDIPFILNRPQRTLITKLEKMRLRGKPIRLILLKSRQWGGSTATQIYMAWLQLVILKGANSIIVGHVKDSSTEVKDMYMKLMAHYPIEMLYAQGENFNSKDPKIHGTASSANLYYIDSRNSKLKIGTAVQPESARGGDSTLAHCTEVAMWVATEGRSPEQIVRSVTGGISYKPNTMVVYESTANGTGNFFHSEWVASKKAEEEGNDMYQFENLFIPWHKVDKNMLPVPDLREFAEMLIKYRNQHNSDDDRKEPGAYLWRLWNMGACLEAIYWYIVERSKFHDHADMAAESPSDDIEAFKHSGAKVFSEYNIDKLRSACRPPKYIGEVDSTLVVNEEDFNRYRHRANEAFNGRQILSNLAFHEDPQGSLWIWYPPETIEGFKIKNRYLVVVDIGGMSNKADFSVIVVFDRYWMMEGGKPAVVAQWYGHIDHDILAWKAAQIAKFYDNALLVIESNTLETRDKERDIDGDQSQFILNQIKDCYDNLYARAQREEEIIEGMPRKYGFHTNAATKPMIIANLVKVLREQMYIERDERCLHEYMVYEKKPNGSFGAVIKEHDDILMTRAIGLHICFNEYEYPKSVPIAPQPKQLYQTEIGAAIF